MNLTDICGLDYFMLGLGLLLVIAIGFIMFNGVKDLIEFLQRSDKIYIIKEQAKELWLFLIATLVFLAFLFVAYWILYGIGWIINLILCII